MKKLLFLALLAVTSVIVMGSGYTGGGITASSTDTLTNKSIDADDNTITDIDNNEIKAAAAIALAKLQATTAQRAVETDGSGFMTASGTVSSTELGYLDGVTSAIQTQITNLKVEDISGHIEAVENDTIFLRLNASYAFTVNSITVDCDSGTADGELQIDGTPVTGCADANIDFTSTEETETCSAANAVSAGNDLTLVITDNSTALDCRFTVKVTRS